MSPIHDQSYRHYSGSKAPPGRSWTVIAWAGIKNMVRKRTFLGLLIFAWFPFIVRAVQLYISANFAQAALFAPTAETFRQFLEQQDFFVFIVTIYVGAGLIANDRRANALQIYLSKPLTRVDYVVGKLATLLIFLIAVTLAAFTMLALSSLSKSRRFVAVMYAGLIFFTAAMYQALRGITGSRAWLFISPGDVLDVIADKIFRSAGEPPLDFPVALLVVAALLAGSVLVLERRVRGVEVVT